jgi:hypothetical protein
MVSVGCYHGSIHTLICPTTGVYLVCFSVSLWLSVSSHSRKHEGWLSPGKMTNLVGNVLLFVTITAVSDLLSTNDIVA